MLWKSREASQLSYGVGGQAGQGGGGEQLVLSSVAMITMKTTIAMSSIATRPAGP